MITIIFGATGAGKTSLNAHFLYETYRKEGRKLLSQCNEKLREASIACGRTLTPPANPPIFSDFKVRFLDGYESYYEPYYLNGYYFGLGNESMPTQYVVPYAKIFLSEGQRYFDSRQSKMFPRWVSDAFEMHRHFGLDIFIDVQRAKLIDINIRELCRRFLEVREMVHETTGTGKIMQTTFKCREFDSNVAVENYLQTGDPALYRETEFVHRGNIYSLFDSFEHFRDFLPKNNEDFFYLPFPGQGRPVPKKYECFYRPGEPQGYRSKAEDKGKKDKKTTDKENA